MECGGLVPIIDLEKTRYRGPAPMIHLEKTGYRRATPLCSQAIVAPLKAVAGACIAGLMRTAVPDGLRCRAGNAAASITASALSSGIWRHSSLASRERGQRGPGVPLSYYARLYSVGGETWHQRGH
jgi:hypothetical protein